MTKGLKHAFRMTHISNIPHIAKCGFVLPNSINAYKDYVPIGDVSVINKRNKFVYNGHNLNEYIPFYFGPRSPMLYVIQHGSKCVEMKHPSEIIYCVIRISDIVENKIECIFTDGHALDGLTKFYHRSDLPSVDRYVKYDDVYATQWGGNIPDTDLKRRKEAELLILNHLSPDFIIAYIVHDDAAKGTLIGFGIDADKIVVDQRYYY